MSPTIFRSDVLQPSVSLAVQGLAMMRLPNGLEVAQVNAGETGVLYREIFGERCWLPPGLELAPGAVVLDVGANIGMSSLFFHLECPGVRIFAFEPAPEPYSALVANVERHGVDAVTYNCALGSAPGTARFSYYPQASTMSGLSVDPVEDAELTRAYLRSSGFSHEQADALVPGEYAVVELECQVRTLGDVVAENGIEKIDYLKLDAEKSELEILRGLGQAGWPKVRQLAVEVHDVDGQLDAIVGLVEEHGLSVSVSQAPLLAGTSIYDLVAVRG